MSKSSETSNDILIALNNQFFDWNSVVVEEPVTHSFKTMKGGNPLECTKSEVYLPGPNGEKQRIFIELAPQTFWGLNASYPFGTAKYK